jgi:hypothetical protein
VVAVVRVLDQNVDLRKANLDGGDADAPGAIGDGQFAVIVSDGGRLQDADRVDAGGQGCV